MQGKKPRNNKGQKHGLWEIYYEGKIFRKGEYVNGLRHGPWETHYNGGLYSKNIGQYINGERIGFWQWFQNDELKIKTFYAR